jgi:hypothetical protein
LEEISKKNIHIDFFSNHVDEKTIYAKKITDIRNNRGGNICLHYGAGLFTLQLHYSYIAAALRLHCGYILELRMHYLHFSAAKF